MPCPEERRLLTSTLPNDQLPFLPTKTFSALPENRIAKKINTLSVFFAVLCVIDLFGVFPIVSLPRPVIQCGLYGVPLVLFIIAVQIYTAVLLGRCWTIAEKLDPTIIRKNRYPYAAIADLTYGKCMSCVVTILLDLTIFGGGIPNLLVASQNLQLLGEQASEGKFRMSFCYWLLVIGFFMCPLLWLGSPKNTKSVASVSVLTVSCVSFLIWYCIATDTQRLTGEEFGSIKTDVPTAIEMLTAYGILAFQFDIHPMLLTIQVDMEDKKKIGKAVCYGLLTTLTMTTISTALCAYKFGSNVPNNILDIIPKSGPLYAVILLVTLQLCLSSAVGGNALFQHIESVLGISRDFTVKRCLIRSFLVGLEILIGELLPRFDVIMGLIGGTLTGPLIFILPPLFYSKISKLERNYDFELRQRMIYDRGPIYEEDLADSERILGAGYLRITPHDTVIIRSSTVPKLWRRFKNFCKLLYSDCFLSIAVIVLGLIATVSATYFNYFKVSQLLRAWSPCIGNTTISFNGLR